MYVFDIEREMEKKSSEKETPYPVITHFSHPHPLSLIIYDHHQQQQTLNLSSSSSSCSGCNLNISGTFYSCTICSDYFLHKICFEMAKKIIHPFHRQHPLALLPMPAYGKARFRCEACGKTGKGFSYNCKPCRVSLHVFCAQLPLSVTHISHTKHSLDLTFESPYHNNKFSCDICRCLGNSHDWLYRCKSCEFDAHVNCARGVPPIIPSPLEPNAEKPAATSSILSPSAPPLPPTLQQQQQQPNVQKNELTLKLLQQLISANVSAVAQALLSGGGSSSGGVNNRGLHQLIQLISDSNNHSGGSRQENGGEGSQEYSLQALQIDGGGGGGRQEYFQAVMDGGNVAGDSSDLQAAVIEGDGDGGISGVDPIQSLLEDGDSIDFLTGLLGGFTF